MSNMTDSKRSKLYAGFAGIAALALLTACGGDDTAPEEEPGTQEEPAEDPNMEESPMEQDPAEDPAEEDADVEGAGADDATSTVGLIGGSVSWAL